MTRQRGSRLNPLSRQVLAVCSETPQSMGEILAKLPDEDKDKVTARVHYLVMEGFLRNHRSVRSYGGLFSLQIPEKKEVRPTPALGTSTAAAKFALYDVWR